MFQELSCETCSFKSWFCVFTAGVIRKRLLKVAKPQFPWL